MTPGEPAGPIQNDRARAGVLDDILFFIATDPVNDPTGLHPFLAQGIRRGDAFEVTRLADDVEDMQVAYGVDANGDQAVIAAAAAAAAGRPDDPDPNVLDRGRLRRVVSRTSAGDETTPDDAAVPVAGPVRPGPPGRRRAPLPAPARA